MARRFDITEEEWRWIALLIEDAICDIEDNNLPQGGERAEELRQLSVIQEKVGAL